MPWKEPGKGDKDPWKSGDQQPPDLDEVFRNVNRRLRSLFGGSEETYLEQMVRTKRKNLKPVDQKPGRGERGTTPSRVHEPAA